jgi:spore coat protein U-like protein
MKLDSPYDGTVNTVGVIDTSKRQFADSSTKPVTNGTASFLLKARAKTSTPAAGDYTDTITVLATGSF